MSSECPTFPGPDSCVEFLCGTQLRTLPCPSATQATTAAEPSLCLPRDFKHFTAFSPALCTTLRIYSCSTDPALNSCRKAWLLSSSAANPHTIEKDCFTAMLECFLPCFFSPNTLPVHREFCLSQLCHILSQQHKPAQFQILDLLPCPPTHALHQHQCSCSGNTQS